MSLGPVQSIQIPSVNSSPKFCLNSKMRCPVVFIAAVSQGMAAAFQ